MPHGFCSFTTAALGLLCSAVPWPQAGEANNAVMARPENMESGFMVGW
jgi:hypothetical protein